MATQSLADIAAGNIAEAPSESCPTRIHSANSCALEQFVTSAFALSSDPNVNAERLVRIITIKQTASPAVWNVIWQEQDWKDGMARPGG